MSRVQQTEERLFARQKAILIKHGFSEEQADDIIEERIKIEEETLAPEYPKSALERYWLET